MSQPSNTPPTRIGPPNNPGLRKLIEGKRKWHRPERTLLPPKGGIRSDLGTLPLGGSPASPAAANMERQDSSASMFLGWHERGYLPHCDVPYVTQFVTFMLHDCFPITRRREWESIQHEPEESVRRRKLEAWLDRGHGNCWLRNLRSRRSLKTNCAKRMASAINSKPGW